MVPGVVNASTGSVPRTVSSTIRQRWFTPEFARYVPTGDPSAVACPPTSRRVFEDTLTSVKVPSPVVERIHCAASGVSATSAGASWRTADVSAATASWRPVAAFVTA